MCVSPARTASTAARLVPAAARIGSHESLPSGVVRVSRPPPSSTGAADGLDVAGIVNRLELDGRREPPGPPGQLGCERAALEHGHHVPQALGVLRMELGHGEQLGRARLEQAGAGVVVENPLVVEDVKRASPQHGTRSSSRGTADSASTPCADISSVSM